MSIAALICARGGSKGIPGKNVKPLAGVPLIAWSVRCALEVSRVPRVIVSTDSEEIAETAAAAGAEVPFIRPAELAGDQSSEWKVWQHALEFLRADSGAFPDGLLVVPPTAPLRLVKDLEACLDVYEEHSPDLVITVREAHCNPYYNMVSVNESGDSVVVIPTKSVAHRRQDAPKVYDMTTVGYVARPEFVMSSSSMFEGRLRQVEIPAERAIDIDNPIDFEMAECLMNRRENPVPENRRGGC